MRQLWAMGWCHNRVRVVASHFLVKHLLLPWQWGLKHLWDCQIDADLECDALGWQYVSGCLAGTLSGVWHPLTHPDATLACVHSPLPAHSSLLHTACHSLLLGLAALVLRRPQLHTQLVTPPHALDPFPQPDAHPFSYMLDMEEEWKRFDPDGTYVRRWLPVLAALPPEHVHQPWKAPPDVLEAAGAYMIRALPALQGMHCVLWICVHT
jgi:deoxyribodipyrimidine photolyase